MMASSVNRVSRLDAGPGIRPLTWGNVVSEGGLEPPFRCDFPGSGKSYDKGNMTGADASGYSAACSLSGPPPGMCMAGQQVRGHLLLHDYTARLQPLAAGVPCGPLIS